MVIEEFKPFEKVKTTIQQFEPRTRFNIILIGETGVGKSSLINLICGDNKARVVNNAVGCRNEAPEVYSTIVNNTKLCIYDIPGFCDTSVFEPFTNILNYLTKDALGLNCVIMVAKNGRSSSNFQKSTFIYGKIFELFMKKMFLEKGVPIILLLTHCELDEPMDLWLQDPVNKAILKSLQICETVCGTTKFGGPFESMLISLRNQTRARILRALNDNMAKKPYIFKPNESMMMLQMSEILDVLKNADHIDEARSPIYHNNFAPSNSFIATCNCPTESTKFTFQGSFDL